MLNISMAAENADITGHFSIAVGGDSTVPLTWDASDEMVINALHNLTNGKSHCTGQGSNQ